MKGSSLKVDFSQKFELVKSFLQNIKGKTILVVHYDGDGLTSAIIFARILEKYNQEYKKDFFCIVVRDSYRSKYENSEETKKYLVGFDNIILLDYCFNSYADLEHKNIFVFDHHKSGQRDKPYIINPGWDVSAEELPSASAIIYDFYHYLFGQDKLLKLIAFIGASSDFMIYGSLPYLHTTTKDLDLFMSNSVLPKPIVFDICQNLQSIYEQNGLELNLFEHLLENTKTNLNGFFIFSPEHQKIIVKTKKEELKNIKNILENAEIDDTKKLIIVNLSPEQKALKKFVQNILEIMYSEYTKMTYIKREKMFSCSIRSPKIDLLKIINELKQEFPDFVGGGHSFAAGCAAPLEKRDLLIKKIKEKL